MQSDSGIEHFISKTPPLGGRIKRRISDFLVREITPEGKILELKSFKENEKIKIEKNWPEKPLESNEKNQNNENKKDQLILEMEKFNIDTINAIKIISRSLGVSQKRIGFAGLKDKRAITVQRISAWNVDYERVKSFNSRYIDLKPIGFSNERIEIGSAKGNNFTITIREIDKSEEETRKIILECFEEIKNGIPNYFGEQRFGGIRKISAVVGKKFLTEGAKEAVLTYLCAETEKETDDIKNARKNLKNSMDFKKALREFPEKYRFERAILNRLNKNPNDFVNAFRALPKSVCYLFTHAFQSYLFNRIISKRIEKGFELNAIEGDELIDGIPSIQLLGFNSRFSEGLAGEIEREVMEEERISFNDFKVKEMSEMSSKGARKKISLAPENIELLEVSSDEFNEGKIKTVISFSLEKGNYATNVLREIMKVSLE